MVQLHLKMILALSTLVKFDYFRLFELQPQFPTGLKRIIIKFVFQPKISNCIEISILGLKPEIKF
jgi:hypothetical protein